jgi:electron transport complex protein RnfG
MNLRDSENTWVLGIFLGITALVAALLLALVSDWTAGPIKAAQENTRNLMLKRLHLNEFDKTGSSIVKNGISFCAVYNKGKCAGFVGQGSNRLGYGGEIEIMVGFTLDGRITAVQILRHHETPGLGANVCDRKFQRTILNLSAEAPEVPENIYLDQFNGKEAAKSGDWKIVKDNGEFIYRTGATVTARAVTALVNDIAAEFAKNRAEIQEKSVL